MKKLSLSLWLAGSMLVLGQATPAPAPAKEQPSAELSAAENEARRCEEKVGSARRDTLGKYDSALAEMLAAFQKSGDLEGALAVRAERERAARTGTLAEADFVADPKNLRALQAQMVTRNQDLATQLVEETIPRLVEMKRQLTVAGRLDEAVAVRAAIERLQNNFLKLDPPDLNTPLSVETVLRAYGANRTRADAVYKGQKILVRGTVAAYRADPADSRQYLIYLVTPNTQGWIQCYFVAADYRIREEKQFNQQWLQISLKNNDATAVKIQRGSALDIAGTCAGWDETVRLQKCELPR